MFISKIVFHNFRIYRGFNEIVFDKDDHKNVYIITGNNGFGKTTFLNALVWCLYGKQMNEVDANYKREISELGGYKNFLAANLNKSVFKEAEIFLSNFPEDELERLKVNAPIEYSKAVSKLHELSAYSISIVIEGLNIPSVPCNNVTIRRSYDVLKRKESIEVLIDGAKNELTNEVGPDIFINDFILPKEIAKFFFFDAETIVSLAELRSIDEKRKLNTAYSEVLGIKKYEELKSNLENLRIRFRRKSASLDDKEKLTALQKELADLQKYIVLQKDKLGIIDEDLIKKRHISEQYQEKLIREGNSISIEELLSLKKVRDKLKEDSIGIKSKLKELLEVAPFAISGNLMLQTGLTPYSLDTFFKKV